MSKSRTEVNRYFHGKVDMGSGNSADYVVAHAARQRQRGKNPSVRYKDLTNPNDSLEAATADVEARTADPDDNYTAAFSGRVAVIRAFSSQSSDIAYQYAADRIESDRASGAVVQDLEHDEEVQTPLHYRVTDEGTVHVMLPF